MNQFDKTKHLVVELDDTASIASALRSYQQLLNSNDAFNCDGMMSHLDVEFMAATEQGSRRLQVGDVNDPSLLKQALNLGQEGGEYLYPDNIGDEDELYISEPLIFAIALQYPELREEVVRTAEAIVSYARRANDTDSMWIDDVRIFGIESLYMLACEDLQYVFLLAQFYVPYWDDEHVCGYDAFFSDFVKRYGWHREVIKGYIWCDHSEFRQKMYWDSWKEAAFYQPLGDYLKANPEEYLVFKKMVIERLNAAPFLMYSKEESLNERDPVLELYETLFPLPPEWESAEKREAALQSDFIDNTLENEAMDLQAQISRDVTGPLVCYAEAQLAEQAAEQAQQERREQPYLPGSGLAAIKPLILALEEGSLIWQYIETGEPKQILDNIQQTALWPLARDNAPLCHEKMKEACFFHEESALTDGLDDILEDVVQDLRSDSPYHESIIANDLFSHQPIGAVSNSTLKAQRNEQLLRIFDVFFRLLGKEDLSYAVFDLLVKPESDAVINERDYYERYSNLPEGSEFSAFLIKKIEALSWAFDDCEEKIEQETLALADQVLSEGREILHPQHFCGNLGTYSLFAYLLYKEYESQEKDNLAQVWAECFQSDDVWKQAADLLLRGAYIEGEKNIGGTSGLTPEQITLIKEYFTAHAPKATESDILDLLQCHLMRSECHRGPLKFNQFSERQIGYQFLEDRDDDYQRVVLICFWLKQLPLPCSVQATRIWSLLLALAPIRVVRYLHRTVEGTFSGPEAPLAEAEFYETLEKAGISSGLLSSYRVSQTFRTYSGGLERVHWLDHYANIDSSDDSMFGRIEKKQAESMREGLHYIIERYRIQFYQELSLRHPRFTFDQEADFQRCLNIFVQLNLKSWHETIASQFGEACLYAGWGKDTPEHLRLAIKPDARVISDRTCHKDHCEYSEITLMQYREDHNALLMHDKGFPVERYQEAIPSGDMVIFDKTVSVEMIQQAVNEVTSVSERVDHVVNTLLQYLAGELPYQTAAECFDLYIHKEELSAGPNEYGMYELEHFFWMIDESRRDRLALLLFNHSFRGFKVIENSAEEHYLDLQVRNGTMLVEKRLSYNPCKEEDISEHVHALVIEWLSKLGVRKDHLALYCAKKLTPPLQQYLLEEARSGELVKVLPTLYAERRAQLVEIFARQPDAEALLSLFADDPSRKVRDAIESSS
ncbi:hypothetical protein MHO82_11410 [Vibrio sp. Of7-15]|uniref:hypothetical protein n=1 Tax=Vibrio sp. Of7-15 TaxID=2724879 RepID=UPI001EF25169|nr:hypothetical protein [Vibrio sp. Of7-15]MCG7497475.1 hypothetical protein [Vibrio sp. Of7-15]